MVGNLPWIVIDVDITVKIVYCNHQVVFEGNNPHKCGDASNHPILSFRADTKDILRSWLRSVSVYTSDTMVEFMRQLLPHLPKRTRILFRGDSVSF